MYPKRILCCHMLIPVRSSMSLSVLYSATMVVPCAINACMIAINQWKRSSILITWSGIIWTKSCSKWTVFCISHCYLLRNATNSNQSLRWTSGAHSAWIQVRKLIDLRANIILNWRLFINALYWAYWSRLLNCDTNSYREHSAWCRFIVKLDVCNVICIVQIPR